MTQCEDFGNLRTALNATIMMNIPKLKELALRMMDVAGIEFSNSEQATSLIMLLVGKCSSWVEALNYSLRVIGESTADSLEGAISFAGKFDKVNKIYKFVEMPEGGLTLILDQSKTKTPMRTCNRARNLLMALVWLVYKISTKNRANMISGDRSAGIPWGQVLDDFNYDVRSVAEGRLPGRLQEGATIYDKWCRKASKDAGSDGDAPLEVKMPSGHKGNGCFGFAWSGKCKYGDKCFGVHSLEAKCPNGPMCKFFASDRGCAFTGPDSHDL
jgi:hypothetical protein